MKYTLRQIEVFRVLARTLHFGRAADELFTSQSIVSQEIKRLEGRIGATLFDRSTRRVTLTAVGESLLVAADAAVAAAREFETTADLAAQMESRSVRVAASPSAMNELIPRVLRRAEQALPGTIVEDMAVETGEVAPALLAGEADVGIGRFLNLPANFAQVQVWAEDVTVALSAQNEFANSPSIDLSRLTELPLLLWPRERSPEYFDHLLGICRDRGLDPMVLVSQPRIIGSRSYLIAENRAFGLVPRSTAQAVTPGIVTVPLTAPARLPLSAAWRENDPRTAVRAFVDLVREVASGRTSSVRPISKPDQSGHIGHRS